MATPTVAHPAQEPKTRLEKGWAIYSEHAAEIIASYSKGLWIVPSQTDETSAYEVRLGRGDRATCECEAYTYSDDAKCEHIVAARFAAKDSEICCVCGDRFHYDDLEPMAGEHYFGLVCGGCA